MKTIQEHLREADRKRLLDCLAYRFLSDPIRLLEAREYTVQEIMEGYSRHMNSFIETLLVTECGRSDTHVFYLYPDYGNDEMPDLVDLRAIEADIEALPAWTSPLRIGASPWDTLSRRQGSRRTI